MSESYIRLHFLMLATLRGFFFNPERPEGLSFTAPAPCPISLSIRPMDPDNDGAGIRRGLNCRARSRVPVQEDLHRFVEGLIEGRFYLYAGAPIRLPHIDRGDEQINAVGVIREGDGVPFEFYPPDLQSVCDSVQADLQQRIERFIKLLRWQQEIDGPHGIFDSDPALYWNVRGEDDQYYFVQSRRETSSGRSPAGITWDEIDQTEFRNLWSRCDLREPLAHELLREAKAANGASPRSALLTATSAIEAGVKFHIGNIAPQTAWLLSEMPSPPTHKLLRTYLPELHLGRS